MFHLFFWSQKFQNISDLIIFVPDAFSNLSSSVPTVPGTLCQQGLKTEFLYAFGFLLGQIEGGGAFFGQEGGYFLGGRAVGETQVRLSSEVSLTPQNTKK